MLPLLVLLWALVAAPSAVAQGVLPVPALSGRVVDQSGILESGQRQALDARLAALERDRGAQLVVLLVPTTQPEDIASYANRIADAWKIGRRDVGDGVLLVVATNDRRLRIEVAKALEGAIPDLAAQRVIDEAITPRFRQGDIAGGLNAGVERLAALVAGEALPAPAPQRQGVTFEGNPFILFFFGVPMAAGVLRALFGRRLGALVALGGVGAVVWWVTVSLLWGAVGGLIGALLTLLGTSGGWRIGSGGGHTGFGGGGGFGGGFRSGGGGDFGGGGASGRW